MDGPWRTESHNPSSACEVAPYQRLEPEQLKAEVEALQIATQQIAKTPYDPEIWLNRGQSLRMLGYPELALGDTYKARLLVEAALSPIITPLGTSTLQTFSKKTYELHMNHPAYAKWKSAVATPELLEAWVIQMLKRLELQIWTELMEGLMAANCCADYLRLSKEAVERFPEDQMFPSEVTNAESWYEQREAILKEKVEEGEMTEEQMRSTLMNGGVYPTAYPWITKDLLSRSETLLQTMKQEFKAASTNCTVARSTIRNITQENQLLSEEALSEIDVLGVIAERPILAGETILIDPTLSAVLSSITNCPTCCGILPESSFTNPCCEITYCSPKCSTLALQTYHPALCSKDLSYLTTPATSATQTTDFSLDSLLLLRVLALSIQESPTKTQNPLNSSLLQRLTPTYYMSTPQLIIFNFDSHIRTPLLILKTLNIDIFSNENYDIWILHTIRCRLQNNKHGQTINNSVGTAVNPLYSMFNHSCRPNVDWRHDGGNSTLTMFVERDVAVGEELFISYIRGREVESGRVIGWRERGSMLMGWFGMECRCVKCLEEMEAEEGEDGDGDGEVKVEGLAEKLDSIL